MTSMAVLCSGRMRMLVTLVMFVIIHRGCGIFYLMHSIFYLMVIDLC